MSILGLAERHDSTWQDYYMLLCDTTLLYFQSSKEREPTGVIVLRYATVMLELSECERRHRRADHRMASHAADSAAHVMSCHPRHSST